jgi:hypothetical protein
VALPALLLVEDICKCFIERFGSIIVKERDFIVREEAIDGGT